MDSPSFSDLDQSQQEKYRNLKYLESLLSIRYWMELFSPIDPNQKPLANNSKEIDLMARTGIASVSHNYGRGWLVMYYNYILGQWDYVWRLE